jgi:hypothetical protein
MGLSFPLWSSAKGDYLPASGTFTANGTTPVTVSNKAFTASSVVIFSLKTPGGTPAGQPYLTTATPGTGFTIQAGGADTSVYNYMIFG